MNILGFLAALFKPASDIGAAYLDGKRRIQEARINAAIAKFTAQAAAYENDAQRTHTWEMEALKQSQFSWKDEFWTVILAVLLLLPMGAAVVGVYIGNDEYQVAIKAAWETYDKMPLVFQGIYPLAILASFGIRYRGKREAADAIRSIEMPKIDGEG